MKSGMCVSRSRNADTKYGAVTWIISERLRKAYVPCPLTQRTGLGWAAWLTTYPEQNGTMTVQMSCLMEHFSSPTVRRSRSSRRCKASFFTEDPGSLERDLLENPFPKQLVLFCLASFVCRLIVLGCQSRK